MRTLPPALADALQGSATTLCRCWSLTRLDGAILRFTDHDRDLTIAGQMFEAQSGFDAAAVESELGLATNGGEIAGALVSARIDPRDIEAGRYDGATLRTWLVDWTAPSLGFLIDVATLGEIRRADGQFIAETRNIFHTLDQEQGRVYMPGCSAELGDAHCGVALTNPAFSCTGSIAQTDGRTWLQVDAAAGYPPGLFTRGVARILTGSNAGLAAMVRIHAGGMIHLKQGLALPLAPGDQVTLQAGCDKTLATCRATFNNASNFRGFPYIPAPDFVVSYALEGEGTHQGRPLVPG